MDSSPAWSDPRFPYTKKIGERKYLYTVQELEASIFKSPHDPCSDCQDSFYTNAEQKNHYPRFTYRGEVSRDEATRIATEYTQNAQRDRDALSKLLRDHGDLLVSRWKKKNPVKRVAILTAASPELNQDDWVYSLYDRLTECWEAARDPVARTQLLLPWLTLSTLKTNPNALFALLHYRSAFAPHEWAPYDNTQLNLSWSLAHFDLQFTTLCVVMHGPGYGREIVNFDLDAIHRQDIIGFPRARLILEAQAYLMRFLRNTAEAILATVDQPTGSKNWLAVSGAGLGHAGGELGYRSTYAHQAYTRPPSFEASKLLSICEVQMNALEDHLSFLQTNPQYMKRHVQIIRQGKLYELMRNDQKGRMLFNALIKEVMTYWRWKWLKAECQHVKSLQDRFRDSICQGQSLPAMYDKALGALELFLANLVNWRADDLGMQLSERPGFSSYYTFTAKEGGAKLVANPNSQLSLTELYEQDPLFWCLIQLTANMKSPDHHDRGHLFAFLEQHLLTCRAEDRKRVDVEIRRTVSDLMAYFEILMNVRLHRPLHRVTDLSDIMTAKDRTAQDRGAWKGWSVLYERPSSSTSDRQRVMGNKLFEKMTSSSPYPLDKIMRLEHAKSTRACLEHFWGETRKIAKIIFQGTRFTAAEIASLIEVISANLAPEYLNEVRLEESRLLGTPKPISRPLELRTERDMSHTEAKNSSATPTKQKPNVIGPKLPEAQEIVAAATDIETPQKVIAVSKRSLQILRLMYPTDAKEMTKGIDWATFVRTMADTGFVARDAGSSVVSFENQEGGRIIFDKPDPDADVDADSLQIMAWRMRKWFGWGREGFVLKG
ncbi:hypothetical protein BLS_008598 [Venturia inaequalis]|uniref:Uncharacterized protein n=1 Tax=Venturia inaequalis TaxID=5025 RepID=A0A8H3U590_VENIN|nr:hypothetical protein BLS_008598 [Venturia inaequalis]KAE9964226.1 hypothetical protein EG328_010673 [Venturia inaequalis]KAE9966894.1 hypothetical protein EG327_011687 [Venturia inaequalis]RDI88069.1 hypothetical protein Vi05172_g2025 [Venturia inaequalis]